MFRTLLVLGRVSNLPTVWSNCLAGWLLTGEPLRASLGLVLGGATLLYTGGMFLNDACDAAFDRECRPERPIPRGLISRRAVWTWAIFLLAVGTGSISILNRLAAGLALTLSVGIIVYNALHKRWLPSLVLMALCRCLLYLIAAGVAAANVRTAGVPAIGLGLYVLGISSIARGEVGTSGFARWPVALLLAPVPLAFWPDTTFHSFHPWATGLAAVVLLCWVAWAVLLSWCGTASTGSCVARLIAGMVLVDALFVAAASGPSWSFMLFAILLALALLLQQRVPST